MPDSAYLLIAHGSQDAKINQSLTDGVKRFQRDYPGRCLQGAFLEFGEPTVPKAIDKCVSLGVREIFVMPLMAFGGKHIKEDIPRLIQEAKARYPALDFHYGGPLSDHEAFLELLEAKLKAIEKKSRA